MANMTDAALERWRRGVLAGADAAPVSGIVKWFDPEMGYGYIAPDDGGEDVFVHLADLEESGLKRLHPNMRVTFDVAPGPDGRTPMARRIKPILPSWMSK